tara:strand:- start:64388 stop:65677 length:1290 start_codon:yes stop_codon:yes gene_type:complete
MSKTVIKVSDLSKVYDLGLVGTGTLSKDLNRLWAKTLGRPDPYSTLAEINDQELGSESNSILALDNINFEVEQGDVLGIIGKNGAGKSTLLKILSRITSPTHGEIKIKGRVASLLEVGTGMHPEMTAKQNIYLNGSVMGMTRAEITSKLNEIVDFAGVRKYIDTPIKRFSSGMKVRLGFAVAAFLEPEILIVDEVLAVGDADFQKRAVGKMKEVSKGEGRTVLFVSHNMSSIRNLCTKGVVIDKGKTVFSGSANDCVKYYLSSGKNNTSKVSLSDRTDRFGNQKMKLIDVRFFNEHGDQVTEVISGDLLRIQLSFEKYADDINYSLFFIGVNFQDDHENNVLAFLSDEMNSSFMTLKDKNKITLEIPNLYLRAGIYDIRVQTGSGPRRESHYDTISHAASIQVLQGYLWENGKLNRPGSFAIIPGKYEV